MGRCNQHVARLPGCKLTGHPLGFCRLVTINQTPPTSEIKPHQGVRLIRCFVYEFKVMFYDRVFYHLLLISLFDNFDVTRRL